MSGTDREIFEVLRERLINLGILTSGCDEAYELVILCKGGITESDLDFALDKLAAAISNPYSEVWSEWGFLRAVMISHHAVVRKAQAAVKL